MDKVTLKKRKIINGFSDVQQRGFPSTNAKQLKIETMGSTYIYFSSLPSICSGWGENIS